MELDHPTIRALFEAPTATRPLWAPQGRRLAYTVAVPDVGANTTSSEIWILDAEDPVAEKLIGGISGSGPPVIWSPDGARLAYVESDDDADRIVIVGLDGSRLEIDLTPAPHGRLAMHAFFRTFAWSPRKRPAALHRVQPITRDSAPILPSIRVTTATGLAKSSAFASGCTTSTEVSRRAR